MNKFYLPKFSVTQANKKDSTVEITMQPLVQGFGTTLGNTLRRVLLSALPGAAIFAFRIHGVAQEFQNLPGCVESVLQIGLNIQKILISFVPDTIKEHEPIRLTLKVKGEKKVTAKDIQVPAGLKIINPETEICELTKPNQEIEIDFWVIYGRGFTNFEESKELIKLIQQSPIGIIALSANLSPVNLVSLKVDEIKVGERSVIEKLVLRIKTNQTIDPIDCLVDASQILQSHLNFLLEMKGKKVTDFTFAKGEEKKVDEFDEDIINLDFSKRTDNALEMVGIKKLSQLRKLTKNELISLKNVGQKSLDEIILKLKSYNITLED